MIRLILIATILILYLIIGIPVLLIEWVIGKFNPRARDISSLRMVQAAFKLMLWITGSDITYIGHENVPKDQAVLYVGNHCSYFDILLTYSMCPDLTGYVAKAEMLKVPLLRDWMKRLYCLFLDRSNVKEGLKTILTGIEYIKKGISICIFPEGTRSKDGNMIPIQGRQYEDGVQNRMSHHSYCHHQFRTDLGSTSSLYQTCPCHRRIRCTHLPEGTFQRRPEVSWVLCPA